MVLEKGSQDPGPGVGRLGAGEAPRGPVCPPTRPCPGSPGGVQDPTRPFVSRSAFLSFQSMGICFIGKRNFENFILQVSGF